MQLSQATMPRFAGYKERNNEDLKDLKAGDQAVLMISGENVKEEVVTIVSITGHEGKEVNEKSVDRDHDDTQTWDNVDLVTFKRADGKEESALYGAYVRNNRSPGIIHTNIINNYGGEYDQQSSIEEPTQITKFLSIPDYVKQAADVREQLKGKVKELVQRLETVGALFSGEMSQVLARSLAELQKK